MTGRIQKANLSAELGPKSPGLGSTQSGDRSPVLQVPAPWMSSSLFLAPVLFKHKRAAKAATGLPPHSYSQTGTAASRLHGCSV